MPRHVLIYAWIVTAAASAMWTIAALQWDCAVPISFVVCLSLSILASTFKMALPGLTGTISPGFVFQLVAIGQLSWTETVIIGAASGLIQSIWKPKTAPKLVQVCFNTASMSLASGVAYLISHRVASEGRGSELVAVLGIAGLVMLVVNSLLVSVVLSLLSTSGLRDVWKYIHFLSFPYFLAGSVLAAVWVRTPLNTGFSTAVLAAISIYLLSMFYRELVARLHIA